MSTSAGKTGKKSRVDARERRRGEKKGQPADEAFYVYCVGELEALAPLLNDAMPSGVEADAQLELIEGAGLGAVASRVSLIDYGEEALETHLHDATWTAVRAMRHEKVVDYFARRAAVAPLRFGTIYVTRAGVEKMLADSSSELQRAIERLRGREEWGVNIFCDRKVLMETIAELSPRLRELNQQALSASPGQAYLVRKKVDAMRADEVRAEVKRVVAEVLRELEAESEGATRLRILKDETGEMEGELVGKLAFLIERARYEDFRHTAERLAAEHAGAGFKLELTGPWPAYNFVGA